jgi:hypothetical protein
MGPNKVRIHGLNLFLPTIMNRPLDKPGASIHGFSVLRRKRMHEAGGRIIARDEAECNKL